MRRCSHCDKIGHTKRSCKVEVQPAKIFVEPLDVHVSDAPPKKQERSILIRFTKEGEHSPHILHLKKDGHQKFWQSAPVFQEKKHLKANNRTPVDLAAMVRAANEHQKEYLNKKSAAAYFSTMPELKKPFFQPREKKRAVFVEKDIVVEKEEPIVEEVLSQAIPTHNPKISFSKKLTLFVQGSGGSRAPRLWLSFALFAFILALPYPAVAYYKKLKLTSASIVEQSTIGFLALQSSTVAALHADIPGAQQNLNQALESFANAESVIDGEHQAVQYIANLLPYVGTQIESRRSILNAGQHVALGNTYLLKGIQTAATENESYLTDRLGQLKEHLRFALPQYREALNDLAAVDPSVIPDEYQESFQDFKVLFTAFVDDTQSLIDFVDTMQLVFGGDDFKRYLIVFQNNRELRPTGGFMGSFAILDVQKGKILSLTVPPGGTYDLQGQLDVRIKPPAPLLLTNSRWEFQDSNWWPDFPASAQKMAWFYQHGRGNSVDGVIAVNATVFENLLSAIGPLTNTKNDLTLTASSALDDLQYKVEVDYNTVSNTPKAVIGDVLGQLVSEIPQKNTAEALKLFVTLHTALAQKEIQAYFVDPKVQKTIDSFGWSGKIVTPEKNQDYVLAVNTNIQGQKSDAKIKQEIEHQAEVQDDGSVIDTLVIRRMHTGTVGEMFTGRANISYLRVYVPEGAKLLDAGGFSSIGDKAFRPPELWATDDIDLLKYEAGEQFDAKTGVSITRSFGKTVFANWVVTNPGEISEVYLTYRIPALVDMNESPKTSPDKWQTVFFGQEPRQASRYSLVVQKQSGIESDFISTVIYPKTWHPVWKSDENIDLALNGAVYKTRLDKDLLYGIVLEK